MSGQLICIAGIDGAGKSTQAQRLVRRLRQEGYRARYVWGGRRAMLTAPFVRGGKRFLGAPARPTHGAPPENSAYRAYVAQARRKLGKPALQVAWRTLALSEHMLQLAATVEMPLLRGEIVVCDRYIYDTLINHMALLGFEPWQLIAMLNRPLVRITPRPALGFWLNIEPAVALGRKTDIYDIQQLDARAPLYAALSTILGFTPLDAARDADVIAHEIWDAATHMLAARGKQPGIEHAVIRH